MALRQGEAGAPAEEIRRKMEVAEATYLRWKKKYGGLGISELRELRQVRENRKLKGIVADLTLDRTILQEVAERDLGRRWRFGFSDTEIELVEPANAACAPAQ